jgi:hypothetical protein
MLRPRLTFANVIACSALFIALGGTGYAALKLPKNSVGNLQLKGGAVNSAKVADGSLKAVDFAAGQLPAGATGATGTTGASGTQGPAGTAGANGANGINGTNGTNGATGSPGPFPDTLPSGKTIRGAYALSGPGTASAETAISYVWPLASAPAVVRVPLGGPNPAGCPGTPANPTANPGYLCIYVGVQSSNTNFAQLNFFNPANGISSSSLQGVVVYANGLAPGYWESEGTWAVTGS